MFSPHVMKMAPAALIVGAACAMGTSPDAGAQPSQCQPTESASVCELPGDAEIAVAPDQSGETPGANTQNGPYGPAGSTPPLGDD
jgi:hypothetical protein